MNLRPIAGFLGYFITDYGRVWSAPRKGRVVGQWLKPRPNTNSGGHLFVVLRRNGVATNKAVHRLVLEAFVGPCPPGMEACHYPDQNPVNNRLDNLRWDTHKINVHESIQNHGTGYLSHPGESHGRAILREADVLFIRTSALSRGDLAQKFGVSYGCIESIKSKHTWRYLE